VDSHPVDYEAFKYFENLDRSSRKASWNAKYRVKGLPGLEPGERVWVKASTDKGREGTVLRANDNPDSFVGDCRWARPTP